jgi:peptide/nickel transport system substrate-binding protein
LDTTVPVPRSKDTGSQYDNHPVSSGPYQIESYTRGKQMVLVRNKYWSRKTDRVRGAYPDKIVVHIGVDPAVLDRRMIADSGADKNAIMFDSPVQPADLSTVLKDSKLRARTTIGRTSQVNYIAINTKKVPDVIVRRALELAVNKEEIRTAAGGATAGDYADTPTMPAIAGTPDLSGMYDVPPAGDPGGARQLLEKAGVKLPVRLTLQVPDSAGGQRFGAAVSAGLERDGSFRIAVDQVPRDSYYTTIATAKQEADLVVASVAADWPTLGNVLLPMFGCEEDPISSVRANYSQFCRLTVDRRMDQIRALTGHAAARQWGKLERSLMQQAPIVPLLYATQATLVGSHVKNAYYAAAYGCYDLVSLSVR